MIFTLAIAGCGAQQPLPPDRMSVTAHEHTAAVQEQRAGSEQSLYDPSARETFWICSGGMARTDIVEPCWQQDVNPTIPHLHAAQRLRAQSIEHRRSSAELEHAETQSCAGISEHNRESSPFDHAADIVDISEIAPTEIGHPPGTTVNGFRVVFRRVPGLTVASMQRIVDCHVARNAAMGHQDSEMHDCLLVPPRLHVSVVDTPRGVAVDTTSDDAAVVRDLRARADRLREHVTNALSEPRAPSPAPAP